MNQRLIADDAGFRESLATVRPLLVKRLAHRWGKEWAEDGAQHALASAKTRIEAVRSLTWRACHALDTGSPAGRELALHAKVFGSETAVAVITDLMQVVGVDSYAHEQPLGRLLQDALALPLFGGSNLGLRRRQLHAMLREPGYDADATW